ncbi:MAG TPA: hypothetical protein VE953_14980 [Terriglobales bacterium]|nr:hypothetical protein [Terriglobales bacterium]
MPADARETPVLDTIAAMTAASIERCDLAVDDLITTRIAALAAVGAPRISYLAHIGPSIRAGVTLEKVQNVLVAVAPIIGTARVMTAATNIGEALGMAIAIAETADAEAAGTKSR